MEGLKALVRIYEDGTAEILEGDALSILLGTVTDLKTLSVCIPGEINKEIGKIEKKIGEIKWLPLKTAMIER